MLSKYKQKRAQGFTIIEVLIVLAIAGLIMLVVFLAIPALQRNSRNNQRQTDVANLLGAVGEYVSNNNGALPDLANAGSQSGNNYQIGDDGSNEVEVALGYYGAADVSIVDGSAANVTGNEEGEDLIRIVLEAECNTDSTGTIPGASRGYAALYTLENNSLQCRES